eukprot:TRINITY_DN4235_c0_g2_i1.p1 TRINITY_DN4235_c0_g2~~TRINITY_DN4235_c0_g2_i1.p1  ORF type:complete len:334 (-),score=106.74 TRINITY_DN4235_c0_g2_i1:164-1165(-)
MNEIQSLLRYTWQTKNRLTIPVSATGSAAMEAGFANLIEKGDKVLIFINGYFGGRMVNMAERLGAEVKSHSIAWGTTFTLEEIKREVEAFKPMLVGIVHAETSTGARQPMEGIADIVHANGGLLLVDTVTSIAGIPLFLDEWDIDVAYAGGQKCLGVPPGISPFTMSDRAIKKLDARKSAVPNWYLDMTMVAKYWGSERTYHHTAPINMSYALREALRIVAEEGLEERWARHQRTAEFFWAGLERIGLEPLVAKEYRLPSLTTVKIPEDIDGKQVCVYVREKYNIEIAGGLGELAGKAWRIGLMGYNSRLENAALLITALEDALAAQRNPSKL